MVLSVGSTVVPLGVILVVLGSSEIISISGLIFGVSTVTSHLSLSVDDSSGDSVGFVLGMTFVVELADLFSE